jgi:hypothetical protein
MAFQFDPTVDGFDGEPHSIVGNREPSPTVTRTASECIKVYSTCEKCGHTQQLQTYTDHGFHVGSPSISWPRPIPVSERLPERLKDVLIIWNGGGWVIGYWEDRFWYMAFDESEAPYDVTHWLPLPPKP